MAVRVFGHGKRYQEARTFGSGVDDGQERLLGAVTLAGRIAIAGENRGATRSGRVCGIASHRQLLLGRPTRPAIERALNTFQRQSAARESYRTARTLPAGSTPSAAAD